ncbi:hypothetical protein SAMD00019534_103820 [Acytostelium subglobosum LB1]|uniref:hypothetical protein n=1 Tax=Acytostelium subglobosum LB1 TaxID=1410327 RepID=UPI000644C2D5|nr:hypothetical protein SAMD00019534_103820 [Acytostelium subglobosum LB1]GAM27207.1 hypothetical protein SAMD00019534_103820 [Acytostelium subglobosum LB1]|eukprot:XP_012749674.1 hypothetical protein SAMD00019534_103820 [Acytostelium subglobosum LB1]
MRYSTTTAAGLLLLLLVALANTTLIMANDNIVVSDVIVLTDKNFDQNVKSGGSWLIEFYAPWCSFCKKLAPIYEELATKVKGNVNIAKIDCTVERSTCQRYEIMGYPTLKFVSSGVVYEHQGERTLEALEQYVLEGYKSSKTVQVAEDSLSGVKDLTEDNFGETDNGKRWFIMFYAPWCAYCKKYMPVFEDIAPRFKGTVQFARVNCQEHPGLCELYQIPGYPTIKYLEGAGYRDFGMEPSESNIQQYLTADFANSPLKGKPWHPALSLIHNVLVEYVYLFLALAFVLGLFMGYTFFGGSSYEQYPEQGQTATAPKPDKQD